MTEDGIQVHQFSIQGALWAAIASAKNDGNIHHAVSQHACTRSFDETQILGIKILGSDKLEVRVARGGEVISDFLFNHMECEDGEALDIDTDSESITLTCHKHNEFAYIDREAFTPWK